MDVFERAVSPVLDSFINGYNTTIFAYGMTGAGKTYTMFGNMSSSGNPKKNHPGLVMLTVQNLFERLGQGEAESEFKVKCSYLEIYNEQVRDLLVKNSGSLMILQDDQGETFVNDLSEHDIDTPSQILDLIRKGNSRRTMASTQSNQFSSRSHALIQIRLERRPKI